MKGQYRERALMKGAHLNNLIINSEEFNNVAYEIRGRAIQIMYWRYDGRVQTIAGTFGDMKRLAQELTEIINTWEVL